MPQSLALGYVDFLREAAYELDFGRNPDALDVRQRELLHAIIQTGVRQVLSPLIPGSTPPKTHEWSWARPVGTLVLRPLVSGTLATIPDYSGQLIVISAREAVFDSDVVGLDLVFTVSGHRYTIVDYVRETVVRVVRSLFALPGQQAEVGEYVTGVVASLAFDASVIVITETDTVSNKLFTPDMVGDMITFTVSGNGYKVFRYVSATEVDVAGTATGEAGAFTLSRTVTENEVTLSGHTGSRPGIRCPAGTFRSDMVGAAAIGYDVVRFQGSNNTYNIRGFLTSSSIGVEGPLIAGQDYTAATGVIIGDLLIEKSFDGGTGAQRSLTTVEPTEQVFDADRHVGMYLVFASTQNAERAVAFKIEDVLETSEVLGFPPGPDVHNRARVEGDITGDVTPPFWQYGQFAIAHAAGQASLSTPPAYDGTKTVLTATTAIFDSGMVGFVVQFHRSGNRYAITKYTSTTVVEVAGAADVEELDGLGQYFMVVAATSFAADDAFTVVNSGGDYELPTDYAAMDGPLTYPAGDGSYEIEIVGEGQIRALRAHSDTTARPKLAAIRPKTYRAERSAGQVFELVVWPNPSEKKTITYRYQILYNQINADYPYPPGGPLFGELYLASCLAVAEQRVINKRGLRTQEFQEKLAVMIDHDSRAHRSEFLGSMSPRSGYHDPLLPMGEPLVAYDGVYYGS